MMHTMGDVEDLNIEIAQQRDRIYELETALHTAIISKEAAENQERLGRGQIDTLIADCASLRYDITALSDENDELLTKLAFWEK